MPTEDTWTILVSSFGAATGTAGASTLVDDGLIIGLVAGLMFLLGHGIVYLIQKYRE